MLPAWPASRRTRFEASSRPGMRILCLLALSGLTGCATVGVNRELIRTTPQKAFDQALIAYASGDLDRSQALLLTTLEENPLDLRATDLLRALLKEKGLVDSIERTAADPITEFTPSSPANLLQIICGRSPRLRAAVFKVIEGRARLREANVSVGPELSLLTRFYPPGVLARITQSVYGGWWERKARMHDAEAQILQALAEYGQIKETIHADALNAYLDAANAELQLASLARERRQLTVQDDIVSARLAKGHVLPAEALETRRDIGRATQEELAARELFATATAKLNALMDRPPGAAIKLNTNGVTWQPPPNPDQALAAALVNRFELQRAEAEVRMAEIRRDLAAHGDPSIDLVASYGASEEKTEGSFLKGFSIGAVTRFPLLIVPRKRAESDANSAFIQQLEMREREVRNEIGIEVVQAYHRWDTARAEYAEQQLDRDLVLEEQRIAAARETVGAAHDPLAVSRAEIAYLRTTRELTERQFGVQKALVSLGGAVGSAADEFGFVDPLADLAGTAPGMRAVWVWRPPFLDERTAGPPFLDWLAAQNMRTVFLFTSPAQLARDPEGYREFLTLASQQKVAVHALNGEADWVLPARQTSALRFATSVAQYNQQAPADARFAAVHLDVEPYTLPDWKDPEGQRELVFGYIELLDRMQERLGDLPLIVDIPAWFAKRAVENVALLTAISRRVDGVVLMAYGRSEAGRDRLVASAVSDLPAESLRFWIGLSADRRDLCPTPQLATLHASMIAIEEDLAGNQRFAGIAVHDYDRYRILQFSTPPGGVVTPAPACPPPSAPVPSG